VPASKPKSLLASIVGWLIVALVVYWLIGIVVGTIVFIARFVVWIVVLGLLIAAYFKLTADDD
jgi:hypothetical protein